jgi:hypothetical protein
MSTEIELPDVALVRDGRIAALHTPLTAQSAQTT